LKKHILLLVHSRSEADVKGYGNQPPVKNVVE